MNTQSKIYVLGTLIFAFLFYFIWGLRTYIGSILEATLFKMAFYLAFWGFLNCIFVMWNLAQNVILDTWTFKRNFCYYNVWIFSILIIMEIPLWWTELMKPR